MNQIAKKYIYKNNANSREMRRNGTIRFFFLFFYDIIQKRFSLYYFSLPVQIVSTL